MSKRKHHTLVSKPLAGRTVELAQALLAEGSVEARKQYRNLKANHGRKYNKPISMAKLDGFWNPDGKRQAKGSSAKSERTNKVLKDRS